MGDIQSVTFAKYLGVIIDNRLQWDNHVESTVSKVRRTVYKFCLLRNIVNIELKMSIYRALVESHLSYGIIAWGGAYQNTIQKLGAIQRKVLKIIHKKPHRFPTNELFELAGVLTVKQLYYRTVLVDTHNNKVNLSRPSHTHNTRYITTGPLSQSRVHKSRSQMQAVYKGIQLYNKLPIAFKDLSVNQFKKHIFKWLIEQAEVI